MEHDDQRSVETSCGEITQVGPIGDDETPKERWLREEHGIQSLPQGEGVYAEVELGELLGFQSWKVDGCWPMVNGTASVTMYGGPMFDPSVKVLVRKR